MVGYLQCSSLGVPGTEITQHLVSLMLNFPGTRHNSQLIIIENKPGRQSTTSRAAIKFVKIQSPFSGHQQNTCLQAGYRL